MEQVPISPGSDLIDDVGFEIAVDGTGDIFALACLREEGTETLVWIGSFALLGKITIRL